jgi:hypothetical protein
MHGIQILLGEVLQEFLCYLLSKYAMKSVGVVPLWKRVVLLNIVHINQDYINTKYCRCCRSRHSDGRVKVTAGKYSTALYSMCQTFSWPNGEQRNPLKVYIQGVNTNKCKSINKLTTIRDRRMFIS